MGQNSQTLSSGFHCLLDALLNFASICLALLIMKQIELMSIGGTAIVIAVAISLISVIVYFLFDLYTTRLLTRLYKVLLKLLMANVLILGVSIVVIACFSKLDELVVIALISVGLSTLALSVKNAIIIKVLHSARKRTKHKKKILLVGSGASALEYKHQIEEYPHLGYHIVGCVTNEKTSEIKKLGEYTDLDKAIKEQKPHEVVIALTGKENEEILGLLDICDKNGVRSVIIPATFEYFKSACQVDMIGTLPLINTRAIPLDNVVNAFAKRCIDIVVSLILIILTLPIMLFAMIGIKLSSKGPVIFKQKRIGKNNEEFTMYKFRSMKVNEMSDSAWTTDYDPRKTRFGTFLRKTGIDELPQLFNVLFGSMSIVGPRPEIPKYVEEYSKTIPMYKVKHQVKPGITGLAQIYGFRGNTSIERRIELDIKYIEGWTIYSDIKIILITPFKMFNRNEKYVK
ncbi:MAG: undecaprenyl-phosphate glucose phosphotransferase [Clostridia bacterium]|nr:undecaprenyl-phosphate glucose phosphotransferase [Clostridia bacterium]